MLYVLIDKCIIYQSNIKLYGIPVFIVEKKLQE